MMQASTESDSVVKLIDQLAISLTKNLIRTDITEFSVVRKQFIKNCKNQIWLNLLEKGNTEKSAKKTRNNGLNQMNFYAYELKTQEQTVKSSKIESLVQDLITAEEEKHIRLLNFLAAFKQNDQNDSDYVNRETIDDLIENLTLYTKLIEDKIEFPLNILRSFNSKPNKWEIENKQLDENATEFEQSARNIFSSVFDINKKEPLNFSDRINHDTLFSSLISKTTGCDNGVDVVFNLDIPNLPEDAELIRWQIPTSVNYEWIDYHSLMGKATTAKAGEDQETMGIGDLDDKDEGFGTDKSSLESTSSHEDELAQLVEVAWSDAMKLEISEYSNWEMRDENKILVYDQQKDTGKIKTFENFLLIDSPRNLFDQFYYNYINTINILYDRKMTANKDRNLIDESQYVVDCLDVLMSIPSHSFYIKQENFVFNDTLHISGVSCEALSAFSSEYCQVGSYHKRLLEFMEIPNIDNECGSVFRSFTNAIKTYLNYYHDEVIQALHVSLSFTSITLYTRFKSMMDQMRFLADICNVSSRDYDRKNNSYLKGINLVFYIFKLGKNMTHNTPNYSLLLHLFSKSIAPFISFIESWIYHGEFIDPFNEFIIDLNYNWIYSRDRNYLMKAYRLKSQFQMNNLDASELMLLDTLYDEIFNCGKNLALLKICDPTHFLCSNRKFYPRLSIDYNLSDINSIDLLCDSYEKLIHESSSDQLRSRKEIVNEKDRLKAESLIKMQLEAAEKFRKYEEKIKEEKLIEREKKKKVYEMLRDQMEADLKKREFEKQKKKQEDKAYIEKLVNLEEKQKQMELQQKIVKELEEEYAALGSNAEARESAARERILQGTKVLNELKSEIEGSDTKQHHISDETTQDQRTKTNIKLFPGQHHSVQTTQDLTIDENKRERFKEMNRQGHAYADSQMKELIYGKDDTGREATAKDVESNSETDSLVKIEKNMVEHLSSGVEPSTESDFEMMDIGEGHILPIKDQSTSGASEFEMMDIENSPVKSPSDSEPAKSSEGTSETITDTNMTEEVEPNSPNATEIVAKSNASEQTVEKTYRSAIRMSKTMNALYESPKAEAQQQYAKKNIKFTDNYHHSQETNDADLDRIRQRKVEMFKLVNSHGQHVSDSQLSKFLFNDNESRQTADSEMEKMQAHMSQLDVDACQRLDNFNKFTQKDKRIDYIEFDDIIQAYSTDFEFDVEVYDSLLTKASREDIRLKVHRMNKFFTQHTANSLTQEEELAKFSAEIKDLFEEEEKEIENEHYEFIESTEALFSFNYLNIEEILNRNLVKPIQTQSGIINKCLLNYFLFELKLEEHLAALRMYMLCENASFSQTLIDELCANILFSMDQKATFLFESQLNPIYVTEALDKAISNMKNCKYVENFSIRMDFEGEGLKLKTASRSVSYQKQVLMFMNCLELKYKLDWPLNIIITDKCFESYNKIFQFLLQIKLILAAIINIWSTLKQFELFSKSVPSTQLRQLKLFSHEMQHYLSGLQSYIYNQIIQVAWQDLQASLNDVKSLDDLIRAHESYIDYALQRCFLVKKAEPILHSIQSIFQIILKFRLQLVNAQFFLNGVNSQYEHESYQFLTETYREFKAHSSFLYKVLQKFVSKSHELHVNNLSLTLNYNFYYDNESTS